MRPKYTQNFIGSHKSVGLSEQGFTLIEVILSIAIIATISIGFAGLLRNGVSMRMALSQENTTTHRLATSMALLATDFEHAFIVKRNDLDRGGNKRKTLFKIENSSGSDKISLTTLTHRPILANSNEAELTFVVYEVREHKEVSGRKDLYRGETPFIPEDLKEMPPMVLLAPGIKSIKAQCWNGEKFIEDRWDSTSGETADKIPRMVKIIVEGFDRFNATLELADQKVDEADTLFYRTVVALPFARGFAELKQRPNTIRWY